MRFILIALCLTAVALAQYTPRSQRSYRRFNPEVPNDLQGAGNRGRFSRRFVEPTEEEIRLAAYYRYLDRQRSGQAGNDQEDWFAARDTLRKQRADSVITPRRSRFPANWGGQ